MPTQSEPATLRAQRPILLIGRTGMLGRAWVELTARCRLPIDATARQELDLTDPSAIDAMMLDRHDVVVNCAAYANVDGAESETALANRVNGDAVGALARRCAQAGSLLVHYSTDYVFSGDSRRPYHTDHPLNPINAYGRSKALGEELIRRSGCRHLIVRTSWLYAPWGRNFVRTIVERMERGEDLRVVNDQRGRPTSCEHLARCTLELVRLGVTGTMHITDGGECTWYDLACEIARLRNWPGRITPCGSDAFPRPARRPAYSVLDLTEAVRLLGPMNHWTDNLADVLQRLE